MSKRWHRRSGLIERLEQRSLLASFVSVNGVGFYLKPGKGAFERYDIASERWLSKVTLTQPTGTSTAPSLATVDADGIYAAYGKSIYRFNLDGTQPRHLINASSSVVALHTDGPILFVNVSDGLYGRMRSLQKSTGTVIDTYEGYTDGLAGSSIAPGVNRIFGVSEGVSPADVTYVAYNDDGTFDGGGDSPYHGDFNIGSRTWTFPDSSKFVDDTGTVYTSEAMERLGGFETQVDELAFTSAGVPLVLDGGTVTSYGPGLLATGSVSVGGAQTILANDRDLIVFTTDANASTGMSVRTIALSTLKAPTAGEAVDPTGKRFTPEQITLAADGSLLMYSKTLQSIVRWNPTTQSYGKSIALIGIPDRFAYSADSNRAYVAYNSGAIRAIDLNASTPVEVPFAQLATSPIGLATAGPYVFACDGSGAWATHYTFAPDGTPISNIDWNYASDEYVWSEARQRMYFYRDDTSPNDLHYEDINGGGEIDGAGETPLHGDVDFVHPVRVSPDGSVVITGGGHLFDARSLDLLDQSLANNIQDACWIGSTVLTIRDSDGKTEVQQWSGSSYEPTGSRSLDGTPVRIMTLAGGAKAVVITLGANGVPTYTTISADLKPELSMPILNGVLSVSTTDARDTIMGFHRNSKYFALIVNGVETHFRYSQVRQLEISTGDGADVVTLADLTIPAMVNGGGGGDTITGGLADDRLIGGGGSDVIYGSLGNDLIEGGKHADSLYGGAGDDRLIPFSSSSDADVVVGDGGRDCADYSRETASLNLLRGGTFNASLSDDIRASIEQIIGGSGNDRIGNARSDGIRIDGGAGDDTLTGGNGADTLVAGRGTDQLFGMRGNDEFVLGVIDGAIDKIDGGLGRDLLKDPGNNDRDIFTFMS